MKRNAGPQGKGIFAHRHGWRCVFLAGLLMVLLTPLLMFSSTSVYAAPLAFDKNAFTVSPTRGPVGAVIAVSGSGLFISDGTKVNLGYTVDDKNCTIVGGGQAGVAQDGAFRGWFRWPTNTGTGTFGVCATVGSFTFKVGSYQVLSASVARIAVTPTAPQAGKQATVSGSNFLPGGVSVRLIWRSTSGGSSTVLGTAVASSSGRVSYTFTVPARSSTGNYTLTATVGSGSPPTLSASTTFHVDGITIVAVPTPTANASPTTAATAPAQASPTAQSSTTLPVTTDSGQASKTGLFVSIALGGTLIILLSLGAGVFFVRKQRRLAGLSDPVSGPLLWPEAASMMTRGPVSGPGISGAGISGPGGSGPGAVTPWPGAMYPGGNSPMGNPGMEYMPLPGNTAPQVVVPPSVVKKAVAVPFDPGLVEAMREAQVSLFATPRPPVNEEIEAR